MQDGGKCHIFKTYFADSTCRKLIWKNDQMQLSLASLIAQARKLLGVEKTKTLVHICMCV